MGLDISVYKNIKRVGPCPASADYDYEKYLCVTDHPDVPRRGVEPGLYEREHVMNFPCGAYSAYNRWRGLLSKCGIFAADEAVWADPDSFAGKPFVEIVDFSDCEGYIAGEVAVKLAKDFEENREGVFANVRGAGGDLTWFANKYDQWAKAFKVAATENGLVQFH